MTMGTFHFLDVGHGDCSIIEHASGRVTMIDVCKARATAAPGAHAYYNSLWPAGLLKSAADYVNPISYMRDRKVGALFRYIQSHTDMDHMDGLTDLFAEFPPLNFWDTANTCGKDDGFGFGYRREDWELYKSIRDGVIGAPRRLVLYAGAQGPFYNAVTEPGETHDGLYVLAPTPELVRAANECQDFNDCSYVVLWVTRAGRVLFSGDSHDDTWEHILANYADLVADVEIMIAPHHGRDSGRDRKFLDIVRPKLTLFGRAPSEHLAYDAWSNRRLMYITANQAGTVVVDATTNDMHVYVAKEAFARREYPRTWNADIYGGWYWGSISEGRAAA
jgi:competence protein ComEC